MELDQDEILDALRRAALSRPNDAVALLLDPRKAHVEDLDLWGVSEFKVGANGTVEVKFADRVKAIALLLERAGYGGDGMEALLSALEAAEE